MTLGEVADALKLEIRTGGADMNRMVEGGYVSDLLSDVIAGSKKVISGSHCNSIKTLWPWRSSTTWQA